MQLELLLSIGSIKKKSYKSIDYKPDGLGATKISLDIKIENRWSPWSCALPTNWLTKTLGPSSNPRPNIFLNKSEQIFFHDFHFWQKLWDHYIYIKLSFDTDCRSHYSFIKVTYTTWVIWGWRRIIIADYVCIGATLLSDQDSVMILVNSLAKGKQYIEIRPVHRQLLRKPYMLIIA